MVRKYENNLRNLQLSVKLKLPHEHCQGFADFAMNL